MQIFPHFLTSIKTITSGEGGIITTNNSKIAEKIKLFRSHGILSHHGNMMLWNTDLTIEFQILIVL